MEGGGRGEREGVGRRGEGAGSDRWRGSERVVGGRDSGGGCGGGGGGGSREARDAKNMGRWKMGAENCWK